MLNQSAPYFCNQKKKPTMSQIDNYLQLQGAITPEFQQSLSASDAMDLLKAGNDRFVAEEPVKRERQALLNGASNGQAPFAAVLGLSLIHI